MGESLIKYIEENLKDIAVSILRKADIKEKEGNNYLEQKRVFNRDTTSYMYVKADFEPIISEEDWRKADLIRRSRIGTQKMEKRNMEFSNPLICGQVK